MRSRRSRGGLVHAQRGLRAEQESRAEQQRAGGLAGKEEATHATWTPVQP
jgi:hypothetical protein